MLEGMRFTTSALVCVIALALGGYVAGARAQVESHTKEAHDVLTKLIDAHQKAIESHEAALDELTRSMATVDMAMAEGRTLTEEENIAFGKAVERSVQAMNDNRISRLGELMGVGQTTSGAAYDEP